MGKKILKIILIRTNILLGCLASGAVVGSCTADPTGELISGRVMALYGLQGRWVGPVVPSEGSCGRVTQGLMSIGKKGFGFDPFQSTAVINGEISEDGHLQGRLVRQGPDRQDLSLTFDATRQGSDAIAGILQSGRCRWAVTLHRG